MIKLLDEEARALKEVQKYPTYSKFSAVFLDKIKNHQIHVPLLEFAMKNPSDAFRWVEKPTAEQSADYENFISLFAKEAGEDGVKTFILAPIPASVQISRQQFSELGEMGFTLSDKLLGDFSKQTEVRRIANAIAPKFPGEVIYYDFAPAFVREAKIQNLYTSYDIHVNEYGHQLMADELAKVITASSQKQRT